MNNSQLFDLMIQRMGNRKNFPREILTLELNSKIAELEHGPFIPWFLEGLWEEVIPLNQAGTELPEDFLQEVEDGVLELVSASGKFLYPLKRPFERVQKLWQVAPEGGEPTRYAIWGGKLHLAPRPIIAYSLSLPYFKRTLEVVDDTTETVSWLKDARNLIIYATLVDVSANNLKDDASAQKFAALEAKAYAKLFKYNEARQHTNANYHIGEDS